VETEIVDLNANTSILKAEIAELKANTGMLMSFE